MLRVALVDDHVLLRDAIRAALATESDIEIVGEAGDAQGAVDVVRAKSPDVVLLDIGLPGRDGIAVARELMRRNPVEKILFLSMHEREDIVVDAMGTGALGYATKDQSIVEIASAIRAVASGHQYLAPSIAGFVTGKPPHNTRAGGLLDQLSPRERDVFDLLLQGASNREVATQRGITLRTVETHRAHILRKLHLHSAAGLYLFAARHGLLHGSDPEPARLLGGGG